MWSKDFSLQDLQLLSSITTKVGILPSFSESEIFLMTGTFGPFKANHETTVPLWLALLLKSKQKCKLLPPFWFTEEMLSLFCQAEKKTPEIISLQHDQFFEISYMFLNRASDDIPHASSLRSLIEGLENIRREKLRRIYEQNKGPCRLLNLTTYQINRVRSSLAVIQDMSGRMLGQRSADQS